MRTVVINNNIHDQGAGPPQFNFCQSIKMNNLAEIKGFYLKVATSGSHLTLFKNVMQLDGSLPANPVNDRRKVNAVTLN